MRAITWPTYPPESVAHAKAVVERAAVAGDEAIVRMVVVRRNDDAWHLVFGRIDLCDPGLVVAPKRDSLGIVRVLVDRLSAREFLPRAAVAFGGGELVVEGEKVVGHNMDRHWYWQPQPSHYDSEICWPCMDARTADLPDAGGGVPGDITSIHGAVYPSIRHLVRSVCGFSAFHDSGDARRNILSLLAWERRRIEAVVASPGRIHVWLRGRVSHGCRVLAIANTTDGEKTAYKGATEGLTEFPLDARPIGGRIVLREEETDIDERWLPPTWTPSHKRSSATYPLQTVSDLKKRLRNLHAQLSATPPLPWSNVERWTAEAMPLFRAELQPHADDLRRITEEPRRFLRSNEAQPSSGASVPGETPGETSADDQRRADAAKERVLTFVATLADLVLDDAADEATPPPPDALGTLLGLLDRFQQAAKYLVRRKRGRAGIALDDEYDVQDVLGALLSATFDDVRSEEPAPSVAGASSRVDFLLKSERIVVEAKFAREGRADREIGTELIVDKERYAAHPDCRVLVCFVYDPGHHIGNPKGLARDLAETDGPRVEVVVRPR